MKAILYIRVSTDEQSESGHGENAQVDACNAWAAKRDIPIAHTFHDVTTGSVGFEERSGLRSAIQMLRKGDVLLVSKLDRLSRSDALLTAQIEFEVRKKGARIVSAAGEGTDSDDPMGTFTRRLSFAIAEWEVLKIRERTRDALQAKRKRGERMGQIAYGYVVASDGVHLVPSDDQQRVIHRMQLMRSRGHTLRAIAATLNAENVPAPNAGKWVKDRFCSGLWSAQTVSNVLKANPGVVVCPV